MYSSKCNEVNVHLLRYIYLSKFLSYQVYTFADAHWVNILLFIYSLHTHTHCSSFPLAPPTGHYPTSLVFLEIYAYSSK